MAHFSLWGRPAPSPLSPDLSTLQAGGSALCSKVSVQVPHRALPRAEPCAARSPRLGSLRLVGGWPLPPPGHREPPLRVASFLMLLLTPETLRPSVPASTHLLMDLAAPLPESSAGALVLLLPARGPLSIWAALERRAPGTLPPGTSPRQAPTPSSTCT